MFERAEGRRELLVIPFPHPDSYAVSDDEPMAREPQAEAFEDDAAYRTARRAWDDEADRFEDLKTAGAVVIQEHGCGFSTLLGPDRLSGRHGLVGRTGYLRPDRPAVLGPRRRRPACPLQ
ncbi:hypothetical protein ABT116_20340 [Streptomyces sp. NPDC002130]|uniref:hypothetical protein n=1 Tax=Streptomyces sp. NPDC002130 TaxID=3155568 RepID=UPI00332ED657